MELQGTVKVIGLDQQVGATFKKRECVVKTSGEYPQEILVEFAQDKCSLLDAVEFGEEVKIHINIRGRMWTNPQGEDKYFNSIQGWKIEKVSGDF